MKANIQKEFKLMASIFKIGVVGFGGGTALIPVIEREVVEDQKIVEKSEYDTLEDCILFIVDNIVNQLSKNQSLMKFISKNLSWSLFSNVRIGQLDNKSCMDIFDGIIEDSGRNFRNIDTMIFMIVELVNSTCYNAILYESPVSLEQLKPDLHKCICGIMRQFEV